MLFLYYCRVRVRWGRTHCTKATGRTAIPFEQYSLHDTYSHGNAGNRSRTRNVVFQPPFLLTKKRVLLMILCHVLQWMPLVLLLSPTTSFYPDNPSNKNWKCLVGCQSYNSTNLQTLYGMVRLALMTESREVFLNLDHSWIERALMPGARVVLTAVPRYRLSKYLYDTSLIPSQKSDENEEIMLETFHVVVSLSSDFAATFGNNTRNAKFLAEINRISMDEEMVAIDRFLVHNPCFMPLKDPSITHGDGTNSGKNMQRKSFSLRNDYRGQYDPNIAILIRLPERNYNSTCWFFTLITELQNPVHCPDPTSDALQVYPLGVIGWASHVSHLMYNFQYALKFNKVFITPRSMDKGKPFYFQSSNHEQLFVTHTWDAWTSVNECSNLSYAWDPWSCHFLTLSKCNNQALHYVTKSEVNMTAEPLKDHSIYDQHISHILRSRVACNDGERLGTWEWEYARLQQWTHRGNIYLRTKIRHALKKLTPMRNHHHTHTAAVSSVATAITTVTNDVGTSDTSNHGSNGGNNGRNGVEKSHKVHPIIDTGGDSTFFGSTGGGIGGPNPPLLGRCIAIHVRNGDSMVDERGKMNVDRSLHAHVDCIKGWNTQLGINQIFLATDNSTLFDNADIWFPQYRWFHQKRILHPYKGIAFDHISESSKQQEVANLLADMIFISRCVALEAVHDSGLAKMFLEFFCARWGICPPSKNLLECQSQGKTDVTKRQGKEKDEVVTK